MSLVAYGSSGESDQEEEENEIESRENGAKVVEQSNKGNNEEVTLEPSHFNLPKPKVTQTSLIDVIEETDDDIPIVQPKKAEKRAPVKITVPSLDQFQDIKDQEVKREKPIVGPTLPGANAKKISGLFDVLPPPRGFTSRKEALVPRSVSSVKKAETTVHKKPTPALQKQPVKRTSTATKAKEESSDEEDGAVDFLGLSSAQKLPEVPTGEAAKLLEVPALPEPSSLRIPPVVETVYPSSSEVAEVSSSSADMDLTAEAQVPQQQYNLDSDGNVALDEKALQYLCGRRGAKRKNRELDPANIIEINGEDIKPDERDWLVKALTEEQVTRPISMNVGGFNSQSKKKHQITYLAHQAKAMETELKNQWAANRATKQQTQSKYGF